MRKVTLLILMALVTVVSWAQTLTDVEVVIENSTLESWSDGLTGENLNLVFKKGVERTLTAADFNSILSKLNYQRDKGIDLTDFPELAGFVNNGSVKFNGKDFLKQIKLPSGITTIPNNCFDGCKDLTTLVGIGSATTVGEFAFNGCTSLTHIDLGIGVTLIGKYAFQQSGINESPIANLTALTVIREGLFSNCASLTGAVAIPTNVTKVEGNVFKGSNVTSVSFPANTNDIDMNFAAENTTIAAVTVDEANATYGAKSNLLYKKNNNEIVYAAPAYKGEEGTITIPDDLTGIASYAFRNSQATKVVLGGVNTIGGMAFINSEIQTIDITSALEGVDGAAFNEAFNLKEFVGASTNFDTQDGILYNKAKDELVRCPIAKASIDSYPEGLKKIGDSSFEGCTALSNIVLPSSVEEIGSHAFRNATGLTTFTFPKNLTELKDAPFAGCTNLASFSLEDGNENFEVKSNALYNKDKTALYLYAAAAEGEAPVFDYHLQIVKAAALAYNQKIKELKLPQGVKEIETSAFEFSNIETFILPHSLYVLGLDAFKGCKNIKDIYVLPTAGVLGYGKSAESFYNGEAANPNCFYRAENLSSIKVHVSDDYTVGGTALIEKYKAAGGQDADVTWKSLAGAGATFSELNHRAITEDYTATADGLGLSNPKFDGANTVKAEVYPFATLYYDFSGDQPYFTLGIPFTVTKKQLIEALGDVKVYSFTGREGNTIYFKDELSSKDDNSVAIVGGTAVLVDMTNGHKDVKSFLFDLRGSEATANAEGKGESRTSTNITERDQAAGVTKYDYSFDASYEMGASLPAGSYYVDKNGKITYVAKASKVKKALRGFVKENGTFADPASGSAIGGDNVNTAISTIEIQGEVPAANGKVYNVNGQLVGNATAGLPAGLYIVNGKKVLVK